MSDIHPTAIIDGNASIGADVKIGPYCLVGPHVSKDAGVRLRVPDRRPNGLDDDCDGQADENLMMCD